MSLAQAGQSRLVKVLAGHCLGAWTVTHESKSNDSESQQPATVLAIASDTLHGDSDVTVSDGELQTVRVQCSRLPLRSD
jgi:hypothetical protein